MVIKKTGQQEKNKEKKSKGSKLRTKAFLIRAPEGYIEDLKEIAYLTGLSVNAVCLELLRLGIKQRFQELKNKN